MKYLANIITKNKIEISSFFNVTSNFDSIDRTIPTLIVGWSYVKELFPNQDILDRNITDNLSWTFSKREKRYQHEIDIEKFINDVIDALNEKVNYRFFNYIIASKEKRESFIKYVNNGNCSIYFNYRFLYIYNSLDCITLGISLNDLSYIGINPKNFILSLNVNNNNIICDNLKCIDNESFPLIKDNIKVVAYLNYLKN